MMTIPGYLMEAAEASFLDKARGEMISPLILMFSIFNIFLFVLVSNVSKVLEESSL